ncbi:MAG: AhpC/TSA family protein [Winogradskyella sp.]|nr:AhpC/TSA family protein [Winogradskyella sp.]
MMKKFIYLAFIGLSILGCKNEQRADYVINGTAKGVFNGIRVYLNETNERGMPVPIDTALVMNESFTFKGKVDYPKLHYVSVNGISGRLPLVIENSEIQLTIDNGNLIKSEIFGSKSNQLLKDFEASMGVMKEEAKKLSIEYRKAQLDKDNKNILKYDKAIKENAIKTANMGLDFIKNHKDDYISLEIFKLELRRNSLDLNTVSELYDSLNAKLKLTPEAKLIKNRIDALKKREEAEKTTAIGAIAPEFSAPNPYGKTLALSDVVSKGKITMIDFWAAWCGPCRRENPNIVKVYEKYHDKGLEIIGVGLDGRRGQQNAKETWTRAIQSDSLTWYQVSNLRYFDEIAKLYNVRSIPSMFLLDDKGKIIAKDLRGPALEKKISELLD